MIFFKDKQGFTCFAEAEEYKLLGNFFLEDVQGSVSWCDELLRLLNAVETGELENWEGTGNAFTVEIRQNGVHLTNEYTDDTLSDIPLSKAKECILAWRAHIVEEISNKKS